MIITLYGNISYVKKASIRSVFESMPSNSSLIINGIDAASIDKDIIELLDDIQELATHRKIKVEKNWLP